MFKKLVLILFVLSSYHVFAYRLSGFVTDANHQPIPYVSVYVNKTTYGVSGNIKGEYFIELQNGKYEIVFSFIGYDKKIVPITIQDKNEVLNVTLVESVTQLAEVAVTDTKEDPAYPIIRKAIKSRDKYRSIGEEYSCKTYLKASLEKEYLKMIADDTLKKEAHTRELTKEKMNFIESYGTLYVKEPNTIKEVKEAYKDLEQKSNYNNVTISINSDPDKPQGKPVNINLFKTKIAEADFNFYYNLVDVPVLSLSPIVSPLSIATFISYKFKLEEYLYEDGVWVNKIKVIPRRSDASLFKGYIYIVDGTWNIKAIDLEIDPATLNHFKYFRLFQKYDNIKDSAWALGREEFFYTTKEGKETIIGNTFIKYSQYNLQPNFPRNFFNNELSVIKDDAYEKDTTYWKGIRPITLKDEELKFINTVDSVELYHKSGKYLHEQDSLNNKLKWGNLFGGYHHQNSFLKQNYYVEGLINNLIIGALGIGGYRQRVSGSYSKEFKRGYELTLNGVVHYGFKNQDLKGSIEAGYKYLPKHFGKIHAKYLNDYGIINGYESFGTILRMSNYVNDVGYEFGHEIEILNGLFLDVSLDYIKKKAIDNLKYSAWTDSLFGSLNKGAAFTDFTKVALEFTLKFTPGQKYYTEPYKKIIVGSKYPTFALNYRKGLPGIFKSVSNYDFIELRIWDEIKLGSFGKSKWKIYSGKFLNSSSLLFTENKFFRRSDNYLFSDPMRSFQLLDTNLNTTHEYFQANYLHRFNGKILNKIPLLKKLGLMEVVGAGVLYINQNNFQHAEAYAGLEKPININKWKLRFKVGGYYVVSDSNHSDVSGQFKIGLDFFDPFRNAWGY